MADKLTESGRYKTGLAGSHIVFELYKGNSNLIARGVSVSYSDNIQSFDVAELGKQRIEEIIVGMQMVGQLQVGQLMTFAALDSLPNFNQLQTFKEMTGELKVVDEEVFNSGIPDDPLPGKLLARFENVTYVGKSGNVVATSQAMLNATFKYTNTKKPSDINPADTYGTI